VKPVVLDRVAEETIVISTMNIPGGNRKLVFSPRQEYLVLDRQFGQMTRIETFEECEFLQARKDFKEAPWRRA